MKCTNTYICITYFLGHTNNIIAHVTLEFYVVCLLENIQLQKLTVKIIDSLLYINLHKLQSTQVERFIFIAKLT